MTEYTVTWRLTDNREFTITASAETPESAAERMFVVANGEGDDEDSERWRAMGHRSLSVGDNIEVNGVSYLCDSVGFRPSTEVDPRSMEDRLGRMVSPGRYTGDIGL